MTHECAMASKRQLLKTLLNPLDAHGLQRAELLGEETDAQLFQAA
jgi:hypothetical protein